MRAEKYALITGIAANTVQVVATFTDSSSFLAANRTTVVLAFALVTIVAIFVWYRTSSHPHSFALRRLAALAALVIVALVTVILVSLGSTQSHIVLDPQLDDSGGLLHVRAARIASRITLTLVPDEGELKILRTFSNNDVAPWDSRPVQIGDRTIIVNDFRYPQEFVVAFSRRAGKRVTIRRNADEINARFLAATAIPTIWQRNTLFGGVICAVFAFLLLRFSSPHR